MIEDSRFIELFEKILTADFLSLVTAPRQALKELAVNIEHADE